MDAERVPVERDGKLLPEVYEVFKIMARENLALATGHATPENTLLLIREARKAGIDRIIVTHPINRMSLEQQQEAAKMGAYLEYCYGTTLEYAGKGRRTLAEFAKLIKALGAEHCIMSSDLGNAVNPVHPAGIKTYIAGLLEAGISESEIDIMLKRNPARLLDLE
jgi:predicted metal-dependent phosphotriesterase family hydrolase